MSTTHAYSFIKKHISTLLFRAISLIVLTWTCLQVSAQNYVPNELIVRFNPSVINIETINNLDYQSGQLKEFILTKGIDSLNGLINEGFDFGYINARKIFSRFTTSDTLSYSRQGKRIYVPPFWATLVITIPKTANCSSIMYELNHIFSVVRYAHLNWKIEYDAIPNDSLYSTDQQSLSGASFPLADINVEGAWDIETGKPFVKVGVYDSGFDTTHPDLNFVDGWEYDNCNTVVGLNTWNLDYTNHGTKVAGIIGATRNNNIGIAGIAGGDSIGGVSLFGFSFGTSSGSDIDAMAAGIIEGAYSPGSPTGMTTGNVFDLHSVGWGIHLANHSWGVSYYDFTDGLPSDTLGEPFFPSQCTLCGEALEFSWRNGVVNVASRGNSFGTANLFTKQFPASARDDLVICVGGVGFDGEWFHGTVNGSNAEMGFYTKRGAEIDISAPASDTLVVTTADRVFTPQPSYSKFAGTSAAAPHVTGTVALMLSHYDLPCYSRQNLCTEDVEYILQATAIDKGTLGPDDKTGWGLLNASAAIKAIQLPKYQILHVDTTPVNVSIEFYDTAYVQMSSPYPLAFNTSLNIGYGPYGVNYSLPFGIYNCDVYKVTATYNHSYFRTSPTDSLLAGWARSSASFGFELQQCFWTFAFPVNILHCTNLDFNPTVSLDSLSDNIAVLSTYYYYIKNDIYSGDTINNWFRGVDTTIIDMAYSIYTYDSLRNTKTMYNFPCDSANPLLNVEEKSSNSEFNIYPNPANNIVIEV